MGAWKSNVSVFREGKGSVWKRTYIPMLSYVYKNTDGENGEDTRGGVDFGQCVKQADLALYEPKRFNKGTFNVYNYDRS